MASYTTNLNLKKPAGSENVAIGDINNNMDTIDSAVGALNSNINALGSTSETFSIQSGRAELISGGAYSSGKLLIINFTFKAKASATNSPQVASVSLYPVMDSALSCIDISSGIGSAISGEVPAGISSSRAIYVKEIVTDHIYAVTGVCVAS